MRDLIRSFVATAIIQVANVASGIMLARILLPIGRGELATAMLWPPVITAIGAIGISEATTYFAARSMGQPGRIFPTAMTLALLLSVLLVPAGWVVVRHVTADFGVEARQAAFLYLAYIPLAYIGLVIMAIHQGSLSIGRWNILRISSHVTYTLLIFLFYLVGWASVFNFALASLIAAGVVIVLGLAVARGRGWMDSLPRTETARDLLRVGASVHVPNVVAMLNERSDQLLISLMLSPSELGLYVAASTVVRSLGAIGDTIGTLVFPKIAHTESRQSQAEIIGRYTRATFLLSLPPMILGIVLGHSLIVLIFGPSFSSATVVMQVLLLSVVPLNIKCVLSAALKGANQSLSAGLVQSVALVISLLSLFALLPILGLMGAAVSAFLTQLSAALMMAEKIRRKFELSFRDQFFPRLTDITFLFSTLRLPSDNSSS